MTFVTFFCCSIKLSNFTFEPFYLKQVLGFVLILLTVWCSLSSYEVLGDYGWFYGDFFIDNAVPTPLVYTGIYRLAGFHVKLIYADLWITQTLLWAWPDFTEWLWLLRVIPCYLLLHLVSYPTFCSSYL